MDPQDPILDPVVTLTFLAAQTRHILLGTGIIILPQRNPLVLAKELASLDVLSGGRLILGIGVGDLEPEFRALVIDVLSEVRPDGRLDWMTRVAEPLPMVMVARLLGLPDALAPELKKQGYAMVERISGFVPEDRIQGLEDEGINGLAPVLEAYMQAKEGSTVYADGLIGIGQRIARATGLGSGPSETEVLEEEQALAGGASLKQPSST